MLLLTSPYNSREISAPLTHPETSDGTPKHVRAHYGLSVCMCVGLLVARMRERLLTTRHIHGAAGEILSRDLARFGHGSCEVCNGRCMCNGGSPGGCIV